MADAGDPIMAINLPINGDTLGLQFSVFGKCLLITPSNSPSITVTLYNDKTLVQTVAAKLNNQQSTFEAVFSPPAGTDIAGTGRVVVTCDGHRETATSISLTIRDQSLLTIGSPVSDMTFASWALG